MQSGTITFQLRDGSNNLVSATTSYNSGTNTVTLTPTSALSNNTTYTLTLSGAADLAGNVMAGPITWTFPPPDTIAPTVTARSPVPNATAVPISSTASATFSEAVQSGTITFELRDGSNNLVSATTSYNSGTNTVTLTPTSVLSNNTTYSLTLSGAADLAGNVVAGPVTWSFTTPDTIAPTAAAKSPTPNTNAVRSE